jgi:hypothetical protein
MAAKMQFLDQKNIIRVAKKKMNTKIEVERQLSFTVQRSFLHDHHNMFYKMLLICYASSLFLERNSKLNNGLKTVNVYPKTKFPLIHDFCVSAFFFCFSAPGVISHN